MNQQKDALCVSPTLKISCRHGVGSLLTHAAFVARRVHGGVPRAAVQVFGDGHPAERGAGAAAMPRVLQVVSRLQRLQLAAQGETVSCSLLSFENLDISCLPLKGRGPDVQSMDHSETSLGGAVQGQNQNISSTGKPPILSHRQTREVVEPDPQVQIF